MYWSPQLLGRSFQKARNFTASSHQNAGFSIWVFKNCPGVIPPDLHSGRGRPPPALNTQRGRWPGAAQAPRCWDPKLGHPQPFSRGCAPAPGLRLWTRLGDFRSSGPLWFAPPWQIPSYATGFCFICVRWCSLSCVVYYTLWMCRRKRAVSGDDWQRRRARVTVAWSVGVWWSLWNEAFYHVTCSRQTSSETSVHVLQQIPAHLRPSARLPLPVQLLSGDCIRFTIETICIGLESHFASLR